MKTQIFTDGLEGAAELIKQGALVAVPTETVYGLAGNGLDESAVREIYEVKGRPAIKPLSLMVHGARQMDEYCEDVPQGAKLLAASFWPGPLTIVLKSRACVPDIVRAGGSTVGLRCPDHLMTLEAMRLAGVPFAAPSANPSGAPSPKTARAVLDYFDGRIAGVIDGGECGIGTESTIIDMSAAPYRILRRGALPEEEIADALCGGMTLVGITGGTGCGKTTALRELERMGALIIDCDEVYHELLSGGGAMTDEIGERFPGVVSGGRVDRKALGERVFADAAALAELNSVTHRHIGAAVQELLHGWAMKGGTLAAFDAIELVGSGLAAKCRFTVAVTADTQTRVRRIMERDGVDREYALLRVKAQRDNAYFEENCTYTLKNDGNMEDFIKSFDSLMEEALKNG